MAFEELLRSVGALTLPIFTACNVRFEHPVAALDDIILLLVILYFSLEVTVSDDHDDGHDDGSSSDDCREGQPSRIDAGQRTLAFVG